MRLVFLAAIIGGLWRLTNPHRPRDQCIQPTPLPPKENDEDGDEITGTAATDDGRGAIITARTRFRQRALAYIKVEMPYLYRLQGDREATRRVVERKLVTWMREQHVRDVDIARHLPTLVAQSMIATAEDIDAEDYLRDRSVEAWQDRALYGPRRPWWLFWKRRCRVLFDG